ncbi:MAG: DUF58 domain-containing protein [Burkholderiales bacterium]|nr:DUF58 domain-containing protein [Burkholderiales bacterium]
MTALAGARAPGPDAPARAPRARLANWIFKPRGPEAGEVLLDRRRVFIFPSRYGLGFAVSLLAFLAASINYDLALGYVLTFYLAAAGLTAMLHTFGNQVQLRLSPLDAPAVFAGETAVFRVVLDNRRDDERAAIWVKSAHAAVAHDLPAASATVVEVRVPTARRGRLPAPRLTIDTRFPLGLFRAWSYWQPALDCLVYPAPAGAHLAFPEAPAGSGDGIPRGDGTEDFAGLREYRDTDNPRHLAWKTVARSLAAGTPLLAKQFTGAAAAECVLDLDALGAIPDFEARLSRLTRWVLDADAMRLRYALRLGARTLGPAQGEAHRRACLEALALAAPPPAA